MEDEEDEAMEDEEDEDTGNFSYVYAKVVYTLIPLFLVFWDKLDNCKLRRLFYWSKCLSCSDIAT